MGQYRKKPVVIEAWEITGEILAGGVAAPWPWEGKRVRYDAATPYLEIDALDGTMRAEVGDWLIRGVKGEFYSCKPDIFAATYEPA